MRKTDTDAMREDSTGEMEDRSWYPVYAGVLVFAVVVITALWAFSRYFSQ